VSGRRWEMVDVLSSLVCDITGGCIHQPRWSAGASGAWLSSWRQAT